MPLITPLVGFPTPSLPLRSVIAASRCAMPAQGLSNGTDLGGTFKIRHKTPKNSQIQDIQLTYGNSQLTATGEADGTHNITVRASIEYPAGVFYPVYFNGKRDVVIEPGALVTCDPVGIEIPADTFFFTRSHVVVTTGQTWPLGTFTFTANSEGNNRSVTPTDATTSGTISTGNAEGAYGPFQILATMRTPMSSIAVIGDSIAEGNGESGAGDTNGNYGCIARGVNSVYPLLKLTRQTDRAQFCAATHRRRFALLTNRVSHVICQLGINDITNGRTVAQLQADYLTIWQALCDRGYKVYQTTLTPVTTSTDSWVTVLNQTVTANESKRTQINDWLRTCPSPLSGVFDVADAVETARNTGIWMLDPASGLKTTTDGTHPSSAGHILIGAALNAANSFA